MTSAYHHENLCKQYYVINTHAQVSRHLCTVQRQSPGYSVVCHTPAICCTHPLRSINSKTISTPDLQEI